LALKRSGVGSGVGPLLLQFPRFSDAVFFHVDDLLARLMPFLDKLPGGYRFAVEIRNKAWLVPKLADALRERGIALALIDQSWMPRPAKWFERMDPITADFTYIRWLGDRKGIERLTKTWDKTIRDCREPLQEWVKVCDQAVRRGVQAYAFANNPYAGHGPATVRLFQELWMQAKNVGRSGGENEPSETQRFRGGAMW
jgi:uncharacterized protein YecE (DUF72 family)